MKQRGPNLKFWFRTMSLMALIAVGFSAGLYMAFGQTVTLAIVAVVMTVVLVIVIFTLGVLYGSLTLRAGGKLVIDATSVNDEYDIKKTQHLAGLMEQTIKAQASAPETGQRLGRLEEMMEAILQVVNPNSTPQQQIATWDDIEVQVDDGTEHMAGDFSIFGLKDEDDEREKDLPGIYAGLPK